MRFRNKGLRPRIKGIGLMRFRISGLQGLGFRVQGFHVQSGDGDTGQHLPHVQAVVEALPWIDLGLWSG